MKHDEIEIRSLGLAILMNFPQFCGEERAKEAYAIYEELKRLAEIGRATEKAFDDGWELFDGFKSIYDVEELLQWAKGE